MKKSIFALLIIGLISMSFYDAPMISTAEIGNNEHEIWQSDYDASVKLAKKKKRPLLVFFTGSDWCGPCKILHADLFDTPEFAEFAGKNIILYKADFPRRTDTGLTEAQKAKNNELKNKFSVPGFPTVILLNSKGEVIGKQVGYSRTQTTEPHMKTIKDAIAKYN